MRTYESLLEAAHEKFLSKQSVNGSIDPNKPEIVAYSLTYAAADTVREHVCTLQDAFDLIGDLDRKGTPPTIATGEYSDASWLRFLQDALEEAIHHQLAQRIDLFAIEADRFAEYSG